MKIIANKTATYWRVHTENLLKEVLINEGCSILEKPISIFGKILYAVADRASEINDPELNSLMCRLTLFSQADPNSYDFDERTRELIEEFDAKLITRLKHG